ncbi:hypothetical protein ACLBKT_03425 [Erythrobacter sp. W302b]|uniref:hypothetical protein n=1 Tax=Erythrobacter sp. W302b TaxID=3389874 RepID=UPI00396B401E
MSRLATSFVLGYHGCDAKVASKLISGNDRMIPSSQDYDWLGSGVYFWESDPQRAMEFAEWKVSRGEYDKAAVVGAVLDLGNCLDLSNRKNLDLLRGAFEALKDYTETVGSPMPKNEGTKADPYGDRLLRFLDYAVLQRLHTMMERGFDEGVGPPPFDTVRGMFTEGAPVYDGCAFLDKTHVQIAVRTPENIVGIFKPLRH